MSSSSDPETTPTTSSSSNKKIVFQTETTGSYWSDVKEAIKKIGEIPCARNSLLSGIASGAGVGVIRGMSAGPFWASQWAVGTFVLISMGTWTICRKSMEEERRRIQQVVEQIPKRHTKKHDDQSPLPPGPQS
ncbi:predicted protein [Postia placenta Mad-698-R]|uniref:Cytochrome c oxidase assembly protein COX20, mitochondrial n=1 Tax=Postia placenta MAD-698-R-SB12 TaxID=670580 RepID=A0A1X6MTT5_9APHY|nr:hypothetical protein POSPLADRAFT_1048168 [Postia placenta MAD-698-R-SB12]EED79427.1 predicted protein [Postia placenta Mad-698-R]OSX59670.1 hypothetical protein POSPLADRAFT_1048168 [Postia placenta MAD-698-R-SB12]